MYTIYFPHGTSTLLHTPIRSKLQTDHFCSPFSPKRVKPHQNKRTTKPSLPSFPLAANRYPMALLLRRGAALAARSIRASAASSASTTVHRLSAIGSLAGATELAPARFFFLEARRCFTKGKKSSELRATVHSVRRFCSKAAQLCLGAPRDEIVMLHTDNC
jgi:hypothetical protein